VDKMDKFNQEFSSLSRRRFLVSGGGGLLLAFGGASALAACSSSPSSSPSTSKSRGGQVTMGQGIWVTSLDLTAFSASGLTTSSTSLYTAAAIFDLLVYFSSTGSVEMRTAESLVSSDNRVWDLTIRPGISFSDGTPYDAAAVQFNWQRIQDPATQSPQQPVAAAIASMEVVDPLHLRVTLDAVNAHFPGVVAQSLAAIGSPTAIKAMGNAAYALRPVGAGPFVVKSYVPESTLALAPNPKFWEAGYPLLDSLNFSLITSAAQRATALESGSIQIAGFSDDYGESANLKSAGYPSMTISSNGGTDVLFNMTKPPFNDVRARRAVALAINRDQINSLAFEGAGTTADGLFLPGNPLSDAVFNMPYDQQMAQQSLDSYTAEHGELRFTLTTPQGDAQIAQVLQSQLSGLRGMSMSISTVTNTALTPLLKTTQFQAAVYATAFVAPDAQVAAILLPQGTKNFSKYNSPQMTKLIQEANATNDTTQRKELYDGIQQLLLTDIPLVFVTRLSNPVVWQHNLTDVECFADGSPWFYKMSVS
jgi:peptide/nickel transport system substrate-binding protein